MRDLGYRGAIGVAGGFAGENKVVYKRVPAAPPKSLADWETAKLITGTVGGLFMHVALAHAIIALAVGLLGFLSLACLR